MIQSDELLLKAEIRLNKYIRNFAICYGVFIECILYNALLNNYFHNYMIIVLLLCGFIIYTSHMEIRKKEKYVRNMIPTHSK